MRQTRRPEFYVNGGVGDTFEGRFDLLVVHVALVLHRLKAEGAEGKALGQELFDLFFADMDAALREMGVGDTSVPKRIREMSEAFYGRLEAYDRGLEAEAAEPLRRAVERNLYGGGVFSRRAVTNMTDYLRRTAQHLERLRFDDPTPGTLFPEPPAFDRERPGAGERGP